MATTKGKDDKDEEDDIDTIELDKQSNSDVVNYLSKYVEKGETETFKKFLKKVSDFIDSQSQTTKSSSIFSKNKKKVTLNLETIFSINCDKHYGGYTYSRLLSLATCYGNIEIIKTLINDYNDNINSPAHVSLLTIAINFKPVIISDHNKQKYIELVTFLLENGCKLTYEESWLRDENLIKTLLYQTNFKEKSRDRDYYYDDDDDGNSGFTEQYEEINIDLIKLFIDADRSDKYEFNYDWKKFDKNHCMAFHCIASCNLEIFKYLLNVENAFGMKKLTWNKKAPGHRDYGYVGEECKTLFQYCISTMVHDKREAKIGVQFWDLLMNNIFEGKKSAKKEIFSSRTREGSQTAAHLILKNSFQCTQLIDRIMGLGFNPNDAEYRCYIIRYVAPCVEAMKIVMNENGKYKNTFDLVCVLYFLFF